MTEKPGFNLTQYYSSVASLAQYQTLIANKKRAGDENTPLGQANIATWLQMVEYHQAVVDAGNALPRAETGIEESAVRDAKNIGRKAANGPLDMGSRSRGHH